MSGRQIILMGPSIHVDQPKLNLLKNGDQYELKYEITAYTRHL